MLNGDRPSVTKKREKASRCLISDCGEEKKLGGRKDRMIDIHACCVPTLRARVMKPCTVCTGFRNPGSPESSCRKRFKFNKCILKFKSSAFSFKIGTNFPDNRICMCVCVCVCVRVARACILRCVSATWFAINIRLIRW